MLRDLVGGGTTGNIAVNLHALDTTSGIVQNNQMRVLAQRIPYNVVAQSRAGHRSGHDRDPVRQRHHRQPVALQHQRDVHHHAAAAVRSGRAPSSDRRRPGSTAVSGQHQPQLRQRHPAKAVPLQQRQPAAVELPACRGHGRQTTPSSTSRAASASTSTAWPTATAAIIQWTCNRSPQPAVHPPQGHQRWQRCPRLPAHRPAQRQVCRRQRHLDGCGRAHPPMDLQPG